MEHPFTFPLDPFQQTAIEAIARDENVLVTAKTGSGKTLVGEFQIWHSLRKGKRVFYTTPIKSLSNQKFHDLKELVSASVGIMTGDVKFAPQADVVVMTTEILRNLLFKQGTPTESVGITAELSMTNVDAVIFDEVHYISDPSRGSVWEECLTMLPASVNLVLLSATLDSPQPFVDWLVKLKHKPCHLIATQHRVVPLVHMTEDGRVLMDADNRFCMETYRAWFREYFRKQDEVRKHRERVRDREEGQVVERTERVGHFVDRMNARLQNTSELPALFFVFSRRMCEEYASKVSHDLLTSSESADVRHIVDFHLHHYAYLQTMPSYHQLRDLLQKGVAFHHSGMLPILKEIVELLFAKGFVKVLFATETFAVGINMPTKTVVFTSFQKVYGDSGTMRMLTPGEYIQMAGRAGRRGKDVRGNVYYLPSHTPEDPFAVSGMMNGKPATIQSQMKYDIAYVLATLNAGRDIRDQTYHSQGVRDEKNALDEELQWALRPQAHPDCAEKYRLQQEFGRAVNAEKKTLQSALSRWENTHMGPVWIARWKEYLASRDMDAKDAQIRSRLRELEDDPTAESRAYLETHGYTKDGVLTMKGQMASEVHEGHPVAMTELFLSVPKSWDASAILQALSRFLEPEEWEEPVREWIEQGIVPSIEPGTFVRAMLKLANMAREWTAMATIAKDTDMVQRMVGAEALIVKDFVVPNSLYLRL
jgi:superfamily II RNA helicase